MKKVFKKDFFQKLKQKQASAMIAKNAF